MFDVGFMELVLVSVIGLLVLGPQRLPKVAAELGKWVGRARRTATQLRRQLEREIELSELETPPEKRPAEPPAPDAKAPPAPAPDTPPRASTEPAPVDAEPTIAPPAEKEADAADRESAAHGWDSRERPDRPDKTQSR